VRKQTFCLAINSVLIVAILSILSSTATASSSINIFPPDSKPYGLSYSEHAQNFWKWAYGIPAKDNPINDPTGEKCAYGQSLTNSSVFMLPINNGGLSERTCKVTAGKGLLIPVMQVAISDKEYPGASVEQLSESAKKDQDSVNSLYLKIDDKEYNYQDLLKYRTHTQPFEVIIPNNGVFGIVEGGLSKVVADGFYIITEPLQKGTYQIQFKSSLICTGEECAEANFVQDIKYNIIAE
jgi:hypothetical protein